jgi:hypothetical protein
LSETVTDVSFIYKSCIAYSLVTEEQEELKKAREELLKQPGSSK